MALDLLTMTLVGATPLLFAVSGGLIAETAGVINFALEGMMLAGAFAAVWGSWISGSAWLGLLAGAGAGLLVGLLHGAASVWLRADQIVSSIALNGLAAGMTGLLLHQVFGAYGTSPTVAALPRFQGFAALPSPAAVSVMVPLAWLPAAVLTLGLTRTTAGWRLRACGENPAAARAAGIRVAAVRLGATAASGLLAGLGGVSLAIGELSQFVENLTQGRGYLAVAALILGRWRPLGVLAAALLFGFGQALAELLAVRWSGFPSQVFLAFPYLLCLLVLLGGRGRHHPPSALGR